MSRTEADHLGKIDAELIKNLDVDGIGLSCLCSVISAVEAYQHYSQGRQDRFLRSVIEASADGTYALGATLEMQVARTALVGKLGRSCFVALSLF